MCNQWLFHCKFSSRVPRGYQISHSSYFERRWLADRKKDEAEVDMIFSTREYLISFLMIEFLENKIKSSRKINLSIVRNNTRTTTTLNTIQWLNNRSNPEMFQHTRHCVSRSFFVFFFFIFLIPYVIQDCKNRKPFIEMEMCTDFLEREEWEIKVRWRNEREEGKQAR